MGSEPQPHSVPLSFLGGTRRPGAPSSPWTLGLLALSGVLALLLSPAPALVAQAPPAPGAVLLAPAGCNPARVELASHPQGGFLAAWLDGSVRLRRFGDDGAPLSPRRTVGPETADFFTPPRVAVASSGAVAVAYREPEGPLQVAVLHPSTLRPVDQALVLGGPFDSFGLVADGEGGFLVVVHRGTALEVARIGVDGALDGPVRELALPPEVFSFAITGVVLQPGGDLWVAGTIQLPTSPPSGSLNLLRLPAGGDEVQVVRGEGLLFLQGVSVAAARAGTVALVWNDGFEITLELFDSQGDPIGEPRVVARRQDRGDEERQGNLGFGTVLESDGAGNLLLAWQEGGTLGPFPTVRVLALTPEGEPAGPSWTVFAGAENEETPPLALTTLEDGRAVVAWTRFRPLPILPPDCAVRSGPFARFLPLGGPEALLLGDGRFRMEVDWQVPSRGTEGRGRAIPGTSDTGSFWFFEPDNLELTVKLLDGRSINGHFWFFFGALTDVGYEITVTDQVTDETKVYRGEPGVQESFSDTMAFPAVP